MVSNQRHQLTAIVTGGTGSIGEAIATGLASNGLSVIIISRSETKAAAVVERITTKTGNPKIASKIANLARQEEIHTLASSWNDPLNILINNAAIAPPQRIETADGIEMQLATNVLAYNWMIQAFKDSLIASPKSRIINVASYWAGGLDLDDLEFKRRPYHNHAAYRQSKQANRMLTPIFADLLSHHGITVNSCHPGDVNSRLSNDLGFGGSQSPEQGAATPVWLALSGDVSQLTGKYFENKKEIHCPFAVNQIDSERLFDKCNGYAQTGKN
jgi:NAD(P)-dependent dehydrogenase (short-subunit alcohol dehydrogenase family)